MVDHDDEPIAGAFVTIVSGTVPTPEIALVTGADGSVAFTLPGGRFRVRAHTSDGRSGETAVTIPPGGFVIRIGSRTGSP